MSLVSYVRNKFVDFVPLSWYLPAFLFGVPKGDTKKAGGSSGSRLEFAKLKYGDKRGSGDESARGCPNVEVRMEGGERGAFVPTLLMRLREEQTTLRVQTKAAGL